MKKNPALKILALFLAASAVFCTRAVYANDIPFADAISVRNAGASGALAPYITDSYAPFVNPAGLGFTRQQEIAGMYYNLFENSLISALAYALPLMDKGTLDFSFVYMSTADVEERDINNSLTGEKFSENYTGLFASYGVSLLPFLSAGAAVKYINHALAGSYTGAYGADLGLDALLPYNIRLSAIFDNIIKPEFKYADGASDMLPFHADFTLAGGIGLAAALHDTLLAGVGAAKDEFDRQWGWHAGAEYSINDGAAALRGGINDGGWSVGASVCMYGATFDYAYIKMPLDFMHRFSASYSFGQDIRELEERMNTKEEKLKYELVQKIRQDAVDGFRASITDAMTKGDMEAAQADVQKALVWAPYDEWFKGKEQEINGLINKDKKERLKSEADKLMKEGSYIDALVALKNVLDLDPDNADAKTRFESAQQSVKTMGEKNMAIETQNTVMIKQHFESGLDLYASGDYVKALKEWNKVIDSSPMQRQVYTFIKKVEDKIQQGQEQEKNTQIDRREKLTDMYNQAVILQTKGKFEESIGMWREILKLDPNNKEAKAYLDKVTEEYQKIQRQNLEW
jgi:tetratricopeptide (TPR) repeat protein